MPSGAGDLQELNAVFMITEKDFHDIIGKKVSNEIMKHMIKANMPLQIASQLCDVIDRHEKAEHMIRLLKEWNEWLEHQRKQQEQLQRFLCDW